MPASFSGNSVGMQLHAPPLPVFSYLLVGPPMAPHFKFQHEIELCLWVTLFPGAGVSGRENHPAIRKKPKHGFQPKAQFPDSTIPLFSLHSKTLVVLPTPKRYLQMENV